MNFISNTMETRLHLLEAEVDAIVETLKPRQYNATNVIAVTKELLEVNEHLMGLRDDLFPAVGNKERYDNFISRRDSLNMRIDDIVNTYLKKKD